METLQRDKTLDIAKGICIILMVIGHSGCPTYLHDFIYMFHMPCFFFISGWLLNDRYITDLKTGLIQKAPGLPEGFVIFGRFAMTCCVEDITFLGMMCKTSLTETPAHRSWIDLTAKIKVEFAREYKGKGPILYPVEMKPAEKPSDELVYFS